MQAGALTGADVMTYTSRVLVNGVPRPVLEWNRDSELQGDLPSQVVASSGITQATGSVAWASDEDTTDGSLNPWNPSTGWIPQNGDHIEIWAGDGVSEWCQFVGVIDKTSGDIHGGLSSTLIDYHDNFSRILNIPHLTAKMPPVDHAPSPGWKWRYPGLSAVFYANMAARAAGFHSTAPPDVFTILDVPMQGSMWPALGIAFEVYRASNQATAPVIHSAPWGESRADFYAEYEAAHPSQGNKPIQLTLMRTGAHAGTASIRANYGSGHVELRLTGSQGQVWVSGARVATVSLTTSTVVQCVLRNGVVTLRGNEGVMDSKPVTWGNSQPLGRIIVKADANSRVAGAQLSHPNSPGYEFIAQGWAPTYRPQTGVFNQTQVRALPAQSNRTALQILTDISEATLRPFWIDETGVLRCVGSDLLYARTPVRVLTTLDDVRELSWSSGLLSSRSSVVGKYRRPTVNVSPRHTITVWESGTDAVLTSGETAVQLAEAPDNEDWGLVDGNINPVTGDPQASMERVNAGLGTIFSAIYTDGVNETWINDTVPRRGSVTMTKIAEGKYEFTAEASTIPAGYQIEIRCKNGSIDPDTGLWPFWWGKNLAILRAKIGTKWTDLETEEVSAGDIGTRLEHDFGPWMTGNNSSNEQQLMRNLLTFIAGQVNNPQATIDSLRVGFDPRLQLGDVVTLESPGLMGVTMKCLIKGVSVSAGASYEMRLSVRIIDVKTTFTTYAGLAEAWGEAADYTALSAVWGAASTYSDFNSDPLRGTS